MNLAKFVLVPALIVALGIGNIESGRANTLPVTTDSEKPVVFTPPPSNPAPKTASGAGSRAKKIKVIYTTILL